MYQRVCVLTGSQDALDDHISHGLRLVYGSDAFIEACDGCSPSSSPSTQLPWWALVAPLKKLEDSIALSCLERQLRKRRNLVPITSNISATEKNNVSSTSTVKTFKEEKVLLIYETDPTIKTENQNFSLSKESFKEYLESWSDQIFLEHGIDTEGEDFTLKFTPKKRPVKQAPAAVSQEPAPPPEAATTAGGPNNQNLLGNVPTQKVKIEDPMYDNEDNEYNEAISLLTTEAIEGIEELDEGGEEEINGPNGGGRGDGGGDDANFDRSHPRRSTRIFILDSMLKKKEPAPPVEVKKRKKEPQKTNNDNNEAGPSKRAKEEHQDRRFRPIKTRPMPKKPVAVICGDAQGLWDPQDPAFITVTQVGFGNGAPEAIAAAEEFKKKKKKSNLVVTCNCFEKIGGRGTHKNWKHSVRVPVDKEPGKTISISQFALEIGIPFEKRPRGGSSTVRHFDGSIHSLPRTLEQIEEDKILSIKETLINAGYTTRMAERRLKSRRTFRGGHRHGNPGIYDWNLLLPGGVWVRSREGIARNPTTPGMNEDDVIFSDDDDEAEGGSTRAACRRTKHCICVQDHSGRCSVHRDFRRNRWTRKEEKMEPSAAERKRKKGEGGVDGYENDEDDLYYNSWEEVVDRQRGARQERWMKRQGQWEDDGAEDSGQYPSEEDSGYGCSLGFSSSREEDEFDIQEKEEEGEGHSNLEGTSKKILLP